MVAEPVEVTGKDLGQAASDKKNSATYASHPIRVNVHHSPPEQGRENRDAKTGTWKRDQSSGDKLIIGIMHFRLDSYSNINY